MTNGTNARSMTCARLRRDGARDARRATSRAPRSMTARARAKDARVRTNDDALVRGEGRVETEGKDEGGAVAVAVARAVAVAVAVAVAANANAFDAIDVRASANAAKEVSVAVRSKFAGVYADPKHPGCYREIFANGDVRGEDGNPGCDANANANATTAFRAWSLSGAIADDDETIFIDFSPKGGPRDLVGVYVRARDGSDGVAFPDGNVWVKLARASNVHSK